MKKSKWARFWGKVLVEYQIGLWHCCFLTFYYSRAPFPSCFELGLRFSNLRAKTGLHFAQARDKLWREAKDVFSSSTYDCALLGLGFQKLSSEFRDDVCEVEGQRHGGIVLFPVWPAVWFLVHG